MASPNQVCNSVLLLSWQNHISCLSWSLSQTKNIKPIKPEGSVVLHVYAADLKVPVSFVFMRRVAVDVLVVTSILNCHVHGIFCSVRKSPLRTSRPVHISSTGRKSKRKPNSSVFADDMLTVTEASNQDEPRDVRQTLIQPTSDSSVLVVSTATGVRLIMKKTLPREKNM